MTYMKDKTIRQFINELEKVAQERGDDIPIKLRVKLGGLPITKHYFKPLLRVEKSKTEPQIVICP
jgi:hypothetical protein